MAGISSEQGGDSLNVELNLVPFIDLLSALVLFLLITAVWVQIAAVPVGVDAKGPAALTSSAENMLAVRVTDQGYELEWPLPAVAGLPTTISKKSGRYDPDTLLETLGKADLKAVASAAIAADDGVGYGAVIQALDTVRKSGLSAVALSVN